MNTYLVSATVTISVYCYVRAESEDQAKEIAESADMIGLCNCCSNVQNEHNLWAPSELDGEPRIGDVDLYSAEDEA